jgi:hypothetical protein
MGVQEKLCKESLCTYKEKAVCCIVFWYVAIKIASSYK